MALSTYSTATPSTTFRISVGDSASHVSAICVFFRGTYVMSSHNFNRPQVGKTSWSRIHQESKNMQCTLQIYTVHKNILEYDFFCFVDTLQCPVSPVLYICRSGRSQQPYEGRSPLRPLCQPLPPPFVFFVFSPSGFLILNAYTPARPATLQSRGSVYAHTLHLVSK